MSGLRGREVKEEDIQTEIGLLDIQLPSWPFLVIAGVGGLVVGVLVGKIIS